MTMKQHWSITAFLLLLGGVGLGCTDGASTRTSSEETPAEAPTVEDSLEEEGGFEDAGSEERNPDRSKETCIESEDCGDRGPCWGTVSCVEGSQNGVLCPPIPLRDLLQSGSLRRGGRMRLATAIFVSGSRWKCVHSPHVLAGVG